MCLSIEDKHEIITIKDNKNLHEVVAPNPARRAYSAPQTPNLVKGEDVLPPPKNSTPPLRLSSLAFPFVAEPPLNKKLSCRRETARRSVLCC